MSFDLQRVLDHNENWVEKIRSEDADYFKKLASEHKPKVLWIGCSDSRVPVSLISGLEPGEAFVHRNISNQVLNEDSNIQAVLQYGIENLQVEHVIVCGHYGCGGVKASLEQNTERQLRAWVDSICHPSEQTGIDHDENWDRACELNVLNQVNKLKQHLIVVDSQKQGRTLEIHGWIFSISTGKIKSLT